MPLPRDTHFGRKLPEHLIASLERYADQHVPTGDFLHAVLSNDLKETFARADYENAQRVGDIVGYLYNDFPGNLWGSEAKVDAHLAVRGA